MLRRATAAGFLAAILLAVPAASTSLSDRTFTVSLGVNGSEANGSSSRPAISVSGDLVAFESTASNLTLDTNGKTQDVFVRDVSAGATRLVSESAEGGSGDGPSGNPAVGGRVVAFHSSASNLVAGDGNGSRDVFARVGGAPVVRVSEPAAGGDADGASGEPDVSEDGRVVAFASEASNLVGGDSNGHSDVFVRDLLTGLVARVSSAAGADADGPSRAPAVSPDGRYVSFFSQASNLIPGDVNGVGDVFLADLHTGRIERVTVGRRGRAQNAAVVAPFPQISDVSRDGRFVAFDSDATNLVRGDRNRDTDVFVRDRRRDVTRRVSLNRFGREGDNDSFFPSISPDGRFVAFQSFAENLAPGDGVREDIFLVDRVRRLPSVMSVGSRGERRERERVRQLLQRPALSGDGRYVSFSSTASNLAGGDAREAEDVFLRAAAPPALRGIRSPSWTTSHRRPRLKLRTDDPRATSPLCRLDGRRIRCRDGKRLPRLRRGRHVLEVAAGGPGMQYERGVHAHHFRVR